LLDIHRTKEFLTVPENKVKYFIEITGEVFGIAPQLSFRRKNKQNADTGRYRRKQIKCPHCSSKLIFVNADARVDLFTNPDYRPKPSLIYHKCEACGNELGVNIIHVA
jgi:DNA-directed RNA polymerase subunit RPC12/RpoP